VKRERSVEQEGHEETPLFFSLFEHRNLFRSSISSERNLAHFVLELFLRHPAFGSGRLLVWRIHGSFGVSCLGFLTNLRRKDYHLLSGLLFFSVQLNLVSLLVGGAIRGRYRVQGAGLVVGWARRCGVVGWGELREVYCMFGAVHVCGR